MKKKLKWIVLAILVIGVIGAAMGGSDKDDDSKKDSKNKKQEEVVENKINNEKFNQIQTGMSYEEVKTIIGEDGENISESEIAGIKTVIYQWTAKSWGNAMITFQNDKVTNKAQAGLSSSDIEITLDQYNQINTGMTYDEVKTILGGDGQLTSETEIGGSKSQIYQWSGKGLGANCMITFSNNKVFSKSQFGLE